MCAIQRYEFFIVSVTPGVPQSATLPRGVITHNCHSTIQRVLTETANQQEEAWLWRKRDQLLMFLSENCSSVCIHCKDLKCVTDVGSCIKNYFIFFSFGGAEPQKHTIVNFTAGEYKT